MKAIGLPPAEGSLIAIAATSSRRSVSMPMSASVCGIPISFRSARIHLRNPSKPPLMPRYAAARSMSFSIFRRFAFTTYGMMMPLSVP